VHRRLEEDFLALSASKDERERSRILVAAEASAHPKLRIALEAAARGDVEE
jgi:hypothetical protein